ncbi:MAG: hypothetical protein J6S67_07650 [Methanobrevibacter sp.]|nr:hypothetical protein [Methanobrevibacter sp.]
MLYYSEKSKKFYKTEEELKEAEEAFDAERAEIDKRAAEKKSRAQEVEKAYKHAEEVRKTAAEMIREADKEYYTLRNEFVKDYGSFHMSILEKDSDGDDVIVALSNALSSWFW